MDVDLDTPTTFNPKDVFPTWVRASVVRDGKLTPHPVGVYPQAIPQDPLTKLSAIPYNEAETLGYLKIDFLHLKVYDNLLSRDQIQELVKLEPNWSLLELKYSHEKLFQMSKHGELLMMLKPKNIEELAVDCIDQTWQKSVNWFIQQKQSPN